MSLAVEHLPLLGYFAVIGLTLALISPTFFRKPNAISLVFLALAGASLYSTWSYMFAYFQRSFGDSAIRAGSTVAEYTTEKWLRDVSLFQEAWLYVCATPQRWWWSEQLCLWTTGPFTLLLAIEGRRFGIKYKWAYMLLAQIVAVSFAQNLFFAALALAPPPKPTVRKAGQELGAAQQSPLSWLLLLGVILGNASVAFNIHTLLSSYFLPNLLLMHGALFLPFVLPDNKTTPMTLSRFYLNLGLVAARFRWPTISTVLSELKIAISVKEILPRLPEIFASQWAVLNEHPAQQSIGWDVIFTSVSAVVYLFWSSRTDTRIAASQRVDYPILVAFALAVPFVGVSTAVGAGLSIREGRYEAKLDAEKKLDEARKAEAVEGITSLGEKKKQ